MKQSPSPTTEAESTKYSCLASLAARVQACDPNSANQTHPPQTLNLKSVRGSRELAEPLLGKWLLVPQFWDRASITYLEQGIRAQHASGSVLRGHGYPVSVASVQ